MRPSTAATCLRCCLWVSTGSCQPGYRKVIGVSRAAVPLGPLPYVHQQPQLTQATSSQPDSFFSCTVHGSPTTWDSM